MLYFAYYPEIQKELRLSSHEYTLVARVWELQRHSNAEWFTSKVGDNQDTFLHTLAKLIRFNFTPNGVENILKRLEKEGILELDVEFSPNANKRKRSEILNRIRPTSKFTSLMDEVNKSKTSKSAPSVKFQNTTATAPAVAPRPMTVADLPMSDEDRAEIAELEEMISRCYEPETGTTLEAYKADCETLVAHATPPEKQRLLTLKQQAIVRSIAGLIAGPDDKALISWFNMKMAHHKTDIDRNEKALNQFKILRGWSIDREMTEVEYLNKLESTVIWLSTIRKYKLAEWTDADEQQLTEAINFVGTDKNRKGGDRAGALEKFKAVKKSFAEQNRAEQALKKATVAPNVAEAFASITIKKV